MKCSQCKWWKCNKDEYGGYEYEDLCFDRDANYDRIGEPVRRFCTHPKCVFYDRPDLDGCAVVDGSQYMASLITGPDFGCVNFESATMEEIK